MSTPEARKSDPFYQLFEAFERHYLNLRITWTVFHVLYQVPANVAVINQAASTTFHEIGRSIVEHLLIQLGRLTDRSSDRTSGYLSLNTIRTEVDRCLSDPERFIPEPYLFAEFHPGKPMPGRAVRDAEFKEQLEGILSILSPRLLAVHKHRNKWIAHLDFNRAVNPSEHPLPEMTFADIERTLQLVEEVLAKISSYFWQVTPSYNYPYLRDPDELIQVLKLGVDAREVKRQLRAAEHPG